MKKSRKEKLCLLKRVLSVALALLLSCPMVMLAEDDAEVQISAIFGEKSVFKGLKAWYNKPDVTPVLADGLDAWELQPKSSRNYIYVDVADHLLYDLKGEALEVEVDVIDGAGVLLLHYDGYERSDYPTEYIECRETNKWKTYTFLLQDPVFKNGLEGADFRISATDPGLGSVGTSLSNPLVVGGVRVRRASHTSPISITYKTEKTGNIFFEGQTISFNVEYKNRTDKSYELNAVNKSVDTEKRIVWQKEEKLSIGAGETITRMYEFEVERFGLYWIRTEIFDAEGSVYCIEDREYSYVTTNYGKRLNYNVGTSTHSEVWNRYGEIELVAPLLINAGYGRERVEMGWGSAVSQPGHVTLSPRRKKNLELYKNAGVKRTIILGISNSTYPAKDSKESFNKGDPTPEFEKAYYDYISQFVRLTKDYADSYIIGNEPDHSNTEPERKKPENYTKWAQIASSAIRKEHPDAYILGYGLSTATAGWFEETLKCGVADYFDTVAIHTYGNYVSFEQQDFLGRVKVKRDSAKEILGEDLPPFWITETGYAKRRRLNNGEYWMSQQFPRLYVYSEASDMVGTVFDYALPDGGFSAYGHIRGPVMEKGVDVKRDLPYAARREYLTIACWNKNFGGDCEFIESVDEENLRLYKFRRKSDGKIFIAMWTLSGRENITLSLGTNELSQMDILGNQEIHYSDDGRYTFNLSEDMIYAIGDFNDFKVCEEQKFDFDSLELSSSKGTVRALNIKENGSNAGFSVETEDIRRAKTVDIEKITPTENSVKITIEDLPKEPSDKYLQGEAGRTRAFLRDLNDVLDVVNIKIKKNGKLYCTAQIPVEEVGKVEIGCEVLPESLEKISNWNAYFEVANTTDSTVTGEFALVGPAKWAETAKPNILTLSAGEKKTIKYSVPANLKGEDINLEAAMTLSDGSVMTYGALKNTMCAVYTDTPPIIDGVIDESEWVTEAFAPIKSSTYNSIIKTAAFSGDGDLSGTVSAMWDSKNLYLAVCVTDDVHKQEFKDSGTWKGDGLQIGFTAGDNPSAFSHLFAAMSDDGYLTRWIFGSEDSTNAKGMAKDEDYELKVSRNGNQTVYEMRISNNLFMPFKNSVSVGDGAAVEFTEAFDTTRKELEIGKSIKFSVLVNDDDGSGRKGYIQYGENISSNSFAKFKSLYFYGEETDAKKE